MKEEIFRMMNFYCNWNIHVLSKIEVVNYIIRIRLQVKEIFFNKHITAITVKRQGKSKGRLFSGAFSSSIF